MKAKSEESETIYNMQETQTGVGLLDYTGERMIPEKTPPGCFWEHILRYRFAATFISNKRVLDIACGEGYGAAGLLKAGAKSVVGVDISKKICEHARKKYEIDVRQGSTHAIPLPNRSVDVIVSFETIEHIKMPEDFLDECLRVLRPNGFLIISTPNRDVTEERRKKPNPFHHAELIETEFIALLQPRFRQFRLYTQTPFTAGWWSLRSFLAIKTPWAQIRGFWRTRALIQTLFCSEISTGVKAEYQRAPEYLIAQKNRLLSGAFNPFAIRKHSPLTNERPLYFIAVAKL